MKGFLLLCLISFASFCASAQNAPRDYLAERRALAASTTYKPYPLALMEHVLLEQHFKRANDSKFTP